MSQSRIAYLVEAARRHWPTGADDGKVLEPHTGMTVADLHMLVDAATPLSGLSERDAPVRVPTGNVMLSVQDDGPGGKVLVATGDHDAFAALSIAMPEPLAKALADVATRILPGETIVVSLRLPLAERLPNEPVAELDIADQDKIRAWDYFQPGLKRLQDMVVQGKLPVAADAMVLDSAADFIEAHQPPPIPASHGSTDVGSGATNAAGQDVASSRTGEQATAAGTDTPPPAATDDAAGSDANKVRASRRSKTEGDGQ